MDIESLAKELILKNMNPEQQLAVLEGIKTSVAQAKEVQKQRIGENVGLVVDALKKIESDIRSRYDEVGTSIEHRVNAIKDGRDGINGQDGKNGKDGLNGKQGVQGIKGKDGRDGRDGVDGIDGVSVTSAHIDFDGSLVIGLSSGVELNVGEVIAPSLAESIKVITNGGGTSQSVIDTLASLQTQITNLIPSQTGKAGKYLTTNGTTTSWASVAGGLSYQGTWNASTNSPTLISSTGTNGYYYIVATAGSTNLNGITDWQIGDWLMFNGTVWQKIDQTNLVTSVAGRTGDITLSNSDISGLGTMSTQNASSVAVTGGSINNTTIGATTPSTGAFTYTSTNGTTSTTPVLSFNASNSNMASGATIAGSYLQNMLQNKSATAGASTNYVLSNNLGTDSTYYGEFGMNSSVYSSGTPADFFSINNGVYFSGHDGDITVGSGNGYKTYFAWGTVGQSAHVINATGAIGLNTSITGSTNFGTSGQVLTSAGSGATPTWTTPTTGTVTSVSGTTGRITSTGGTTPVLDLTSGVATAGTTGSTSLIPVITIDTYGRVTSITTAANPQGTVTSVTGTSPVVSSGGATPAISLASGYGDTLNPYASKTANYFLAAPNGSAGVPTFRAVVAADIPTLNQNTTGTASNVTGTVAIANGGTGQTTANTAFNALAPSQTSNSGKYLTTDGTNSSWATVVSGASISNDTTTSSNLYPLFASATSGVPTTIYTGNTKYLYKPSTGELTAPAHISSNGININSATVSASYTIASGNNGFSVGPITVASGQAVTVASGQRWVVL
jgi:hypothetical protein